MKDYGLTKAQDDVPPMVIAPTPARPGAFEIDVQRTAAGAPRDISKSLAEASSLVSDAGIAETMWYRVERGGKTIEGPSVRLAEIMAYCWRNVAYAGNIIEIGERTVTAEGMAVDLERNNPVRVAVSRSIVDKGGRRYSEQMIQTTCQAAQSIAIRNAIFKVIPGAFVKRVLEHARAVAEAGGELNAKRMKLLDWARSSGLSDEELLTFLGLERVEDIGAAEISRLRGIAQAIREEETTVDEVFRAPRREAAVEDAERITAQTTAPPAAKPAAPPVAAPSKKRATAQEPEPSGDGKGLGPESSKEGGPARTLDSLETRGLGKLGPDLMRKAWPHILAASDADGTVNLDIVDAILTAPKTIIQASVADSDPVAAFNQIAQAAAALAQPKML